MKFNYMKIIRSRFKFLFILLFIGLILGGMTGLYKKVSHHHIRIQHIFVFMICCLFILWIRKFQIHESALEIISPSKMFIYMIMIGFMYLFLPEIAEVFSV